MSDFRKFDLAAEARLLNLVEAHLRLRAAAGTRKRQDDLYMTASAVDGGFAEPNWQEGLDRRDVQAVVQMVAARRSMDIGEWEAVNDRAEEMVNRLMDAVLGDHPDEEEDETEILPIPALLEKLRNQNRHLEAQAIEAAVERLGQQDEPGDSDQQDEEEDLMHYMLRDYEKEKAEHRIKDDREYSDLQGELRGIAIILTKKVRGLTELLGVSTYGPTKDHPEIQAIEALLEEAEELKRANDYQREACRSADEECKQTQQAAPGGAPVFATPKKDEFDLQATVAALVERVGILEYEKDNGE